MSVPDGIDLPHFQWRVIQDCMTEATAQYWLSRARALEGCLSKPDDFPGSASPSELQRRDAALRSAAQACRNHANLLRGRL